MNSDSFSSLFIGSDLDLDKYKQIVNKIRDIIQPTNYEINGIKRRSKKFQIPDFYVGMELSFESKESGAGANLSVSKLKSDNYCIFFYISQLNINLLESIIFELIHFPELYILHPFNYNENGDTWSLANNFCVKLDNEERRKYYAFSNKLKRFFGKETSRLEYEEIQKLSIIKYPKQSVSKYGLNFDGGPVIYFGQKSYLYYPKELIRGFVNAENLIELPNDVIKLTIYNENANDEKQRLLKFREYFKLDQPDEVQEDPYEFIKNDSLIERIDYHTLPLNRFYLAINNPDRLAILNSLNATNIGEKFEWSKGFPMSVNKGFVFIPPVMNNWTFIGGEFLSELMSEKVKYIILSILSKRYGIAMFYGRLNSAGHHNIVLFEFGKNISSYYAMDEFGRTRHKGQITSIAQKIIEERKNTPPFGFINLSEKEEERLLNHAINSQLDRIANSWSQDFFKIKNQLDLDVNDCIVAKINYNNFN